MCNLEACIDDERQCKRAERSQAPGDATVRKPFIFHRRSKRIAFMESVNISTCFYMQVFNFRDGRVTTFGTIQGIISPKRMVTDSPDYQKAHL